MLDLKQLLRNKMNLTMDWLSDQKLMYHDLKFIAQHLYVESSIQKMVTIMFLKKIRS